MVGDNLKAKKVLRVCVYSQTLSTFFVGARAATAIAADYGKSEFPKSKANLSPKIGNSKTS